ncbi:LysR family transcriptional regulator [Sphingomonas paucimobilis]|uniref:DNA, contig: SP661 n=2 Tax=Sphingomonas paucimobilis TaxID=13689 RepID=A0A0C9MYA5_SPHPI|nr:LysR family transcriptional regulator [Sphingomonas sp.]BCI71766.1 LysR family transcriptional regulator [Sphingomonas paucimobilis]GAN15601.1 putative LysR family transcriptional regulator [Sphingomonas paucimobilis NBRC 13935]
MDVTVARAIMDDKVDIGNTIAMMSFAAVVSTGSFSAAANLLGYSKAAVSRQISRLEEAAGMKLLDRTTRTVTVTPAGREMYQHCARIADEVNEANRVMTGMLSRPRGDLKVNAPVVASLFNITQAIPAFLHEYPDIRLFMNLSDSKADLLKGNFDVAFWVGEPYDVTLDTVKLCDYEMVLAASVDYLDRRGRPATAAELKEHLCILETHLSRIGEWRLSADEIISVNRGALTSNSVRLTREAMLAGMGIGYLPRFLLESDIAAGRIEVLLPDVVSQRLPLYLLFSRGNYALSKVRAFVDYLTAAISDAPSSASGRGIRLASAV